MFSWSQLRAEIHRLFCSSSPLSLFPFFPPPLPRCLLELSLESDLYYLSLTLSPQLCLFLRLNGDLDKRVWAAREQPLNTKRQTKRKREEAREEQGVRARFTEPFAPCFRLILRLERFLVFIKQVQQAQRAVWLSSAAHLCLPWASFIVSLKHAREDCTQRAVVSSLCRFICILQLICIIYKSQWQEINEYTATKCASELHCQLAQNRNKTAPLEENRDFIKDESASCSFMV